MRILMIGSGGREHALAWGLSRSPLVSELLCCPGSDAIQEIAKLVPISPEAQDELVRFSLQRRVDLVVIGPEAPICTGLSDAFREKEIPVIGPSKGAAQLESSKIFAKEFMQRHGIPTARFVSFHDLSGARSHVDAVTRFPIVVKADGLAAGKGVSVCPDRAAAHTFLSQLMEVRLFGESGNRVVVEDCLVGEEFSYIVLCDGERHVPLVVSQDHKRLLDNDWGPNTGGMGAYASHEILDPVTRNSIEEKIVVPTLEGMRAEGYPFQGVLYVGLMLTLDGPQVLEYNVRLGDPETQPIVMLFNGDWAETFRATATSSLTPELLRWHRGAALCVVLAAEGYPQKPKKDDPISGLEMANELDGVQVFHAGTRLSNGNWQTAGGRVLGVTARGSSLSAAGIRAYEAVNRIHFSGMHYRRDIGSRGLKSLSNNNR